MTPLELLAPARNADIGIAAIRCGADAVYIGGPAFGARAAAGNSIEEIQRLCTFASHYGAKIFVTVNTLCNNQGEREELLRMMLQMKGRGISSFIIQDTGMMPLLRENGPWEEEFHASTQCAIRTPERARELAAMGFQRLILERELSLDQIKAIREAVPGTDIEFFVHGALCVCYSGDCYLSEYLTGRSANRGECAQPCRNNYDLVDGSGRVLCSNRPMLSLKDYCLIDHLPALADAGVISFKIEGRLKNESYVKNVVRAYSIALDRLVAESAGRYCRSSFGRVRGGFTPDLYKTFHRGYTSLFIDGRRGQWHSSDAAKYIGEEIGSVKAVRRDSIVLDGSKVNNGDGLCIVSRSGEVLGFRADKVEGNCVFCKVPSALKAGDRLWRNRDTEFERQLENDLPQRMLEVNLSLAFESSVLKVEARREDGVALGREYDLSGFETAQKQDRMREMIASQLNKSAADYNFTLSALSADGPLAMLPASFLNGIRRDMAQLLQEMEVKALKCAHPAQGSGSVKAALSAENLAHPRRQGELMRTKYCIRHRMGLCPKQKDHRGLDASGGLFLKNNGKSLSLHFDCANCEMTVGES